MLDPIVLFIYQKFTRTALTNANKNAITFHKVIFSLKKKKDNINVTIGLKLNKAEVTPTGVDVLNKKEKVKAPQTPAMVVTIAKNIEVLSKDLKELKVESQKGIRAI